MRKYLKKFGYLPKIENITRRSITSETIFEESLESALLNYQKFYGLSPTGILDVNTVNQMAKPRCGVPDKSVVPLSFSTGIGKWNKLELSYKIENYTPELTPDKIHSAIVAAFSLWSDMTPLTFKEVESNADINILFAEDDHGDGDPFDGIGDVLAHALPPSPNFGDISGDIHFDESETWEVNLPLTGIDLISVAAHEIGHSLGLDHTNVRGALMFAYYNGEHRYLHNDDIQGIQSIYGTRQLISPNRFDAAENQRGEGADI